MLIYQNTTLSDAEPCVYLEGRMSRHEYFLALDLDGIELDRLLARGWRKFGYYFFRPRCDACAGCIPLRVPVHDFKPTKSQRRVMRKNAGLRLEFHPLRFRDEIYEIYLDHSFSRFKTNPNLEDFLLSFYKRSCPSMQSEYYDGERLMGVGFLDVGEESLSSVYFIFRSEYASMSPGIYSVLGEIEHARSLGKKFYYLGYYVPGCGRMTYKARFSPHERYSWAAQSWEEVRLEAPAGNKRLD